MSIRGINNIRTKVSSQDSLARLLSIVGVALVVLGFCLGIGTVTTLNILAGIALWSLYGERATITTSLKSGLVFLCSATLCAYGLLHLVGFLGMTMITAGFSLFMFSVLHNRTQFDND